MLLYVSLAVYRGLKFCFLVKLFELSLSLALAEVYFTFLKDMKNALYNAESPRPTNFTAVLWAYLDFYILQIKGRTMFRHANTVSFSSVSVFKYLWRMKLSSLHGCCKN